MNGSTKSNKLVSSFSAERKMCPTLLGQRPCSKQYDDSRQVTIRNMRKFVARDNSKQDIGKKITLAPLCSAALTFGTRGILSVTNQCCPFNLLFQIIACYELSPVSNCCLLRIVACYSLSHWGSKYVPAVLKQFLILRNQ